MLGTNLSWQSQIHLPPGNLHTFLLGVSGTGKSSLLRFMIKQRILQGRGVAVIDPHGQDAESSLVNQVLYDIPQERAKDIVLMDINNTEEIFGLHFFACTDHHNPIAVQSTLSQVFNIFERVYDVDRANPQISQYIQYITLLLIHNPHLTVLDIPKLLEIGKTPQEKAYYATFRFQAVQHLPDSPEYDFTRHFWLRYYPERSYNRRDDEMAAIFNKFRELASVFLTPIFCQNKNTVDIGRAMQEQKIVLLKLNADLQDVTELLGSILIAQIKSASFTRTLSDPPFYLFCDEFQRFATRDFGQLWTEARKGNLFLTVATQELTQVEPTIMSKVFGADTKVVFRLSNKTDADIMAGLFDSQPEPAWEEELEKASIEVLREVKHNRVEEDVPDGVEPLPIPKQNVVEHLLSVGHRDPAVSWFVMNYLQFFKRQAHAREEPNEHGYGLYSGFAYSQLHPVRLSYGEDTYHIDPERIETSLGLLNNFLYSWMVHTDQIPLLEVRYIEAAFADVCGYANYYETMQKHKLLGQANEDTQSALPPLLIEKLAREEGRYLSFRRDLQDMLLALADDPILVSSGHYQPRIRKQINYLSEPPLTLTLPRKAILHPQRPFTDMREEIANSLLGLANHTAKARLLQEEYDITTIAQEDMKTDATRVLRRIGILREQHLLSGYTRKRTEVLAEIRTRQQELVRQQPLQIAKQQPPVVDKKQPTLLREQQTGDKTVSQGIPPTVPQQGNAKQITPPPPLPQAARRNTKK